MNLTDTEVIKALECCYKDGCKKCPLWECKGNCFEELIKHNVLDLINRQKAEIEKLTEQLDGETVENMRLGHEIERLQKEGLQLNKTFMDFVNNQESEAIKEFADRLKSEFVIKPHYHKLTIQIGDIIREAIDNLVKEMVGESSEDSN